MPKKRKPSAPLVPLTGKQKSYLRSLAHKLKAVVQIGHHGVTEGVLAAVEVALEQHELIKVKVASEAEVDAAEIAPELEKGTSSQLAQLIGHTLVLYRRREKDPKISLPQIKTGAAAKPAKAVLPADADDPPGLEDDYADDDDDLE